MHHRTRHSRPRRAAGRGKAKDQRHRLAGDSPINQREHPRAPNERGAGDAKAHHFSRDLAPGGGFQPTHPDHHALLRRPRRRQRNPERKIQQQCHKIFSQSEAARHQRRPAAYEAKADPTDDGDKKHLQRHGFIAGARQDEGRPTSLGRLMQQHRAG